jgi:hypothetical protein
MAAMASGLAQLLLGYGIVFGTGGGVTYSDALICSLTSL